MFEILNHRQTQKKTLPTTYAVHMTFISHLAGDIGTTETFELLLVHFVWRSKTSQIRIRKYNQLEANRGFKHVDTEVLCIYNDYSLVQDSELFSQFSRSMTGSFDKYSLLAKMLGYYHFFNPKAGLSILGDILLLGHLNSVG